MATEGLLITQETQKHCSQCKSDSFDEMYDSQRVFIEENWNSEYFKITKNYISEKSLRFLLKLYRNLCMKYSEIEVIEFIKRLIECKLNCPFEEFYNNTANVFEINGLNHLFNM